LIERFRKILKAEEQEEIQKKDKIYDEWLKCLNFKEKVSKEFRYRPIYQFISTWMYIRDKLDEILWEIYGCQEEKELKFEALIKDKIYQCKKSHPNGDCESDEQITRTPPNLIKTGSAIKIKSFQKEEEFRQ
jgi:hypothetical protein